MRAQRGQLAWPRPRTAQGTRRVTVCLKDGQPWVITPDFCLAHLPPCSGTTRLSLSPGSATSQCALSPVSLRSSSVRWDEYQDLSRRAICGSSPVYAEHAPGTRGARYLAHRSAAPRCDAPLKSRHLTSGPQFFSSATWVFISCQVFCELGCHLIRVVTKEASFF